MLYDTLGADAVGKIENASVIPSRTRPVPPTDPTGRRTLISMAMALRRMPCALACMQTTTRAWKDAYIRVPGPLLQCKDGGLQGTRQARVLSTSNATLTDVRVRFVFGQPPAFCRISPRNFCSYRCVLSVALPSMMCTCASTSFCTHIGVLGSSIEKCVRVCMPQLCAEPNRIDAFGRFAYSPLQLPFCAAARRHLHPAHRRYRQVTRGQRDRGLCVANAVRI
jgi:hypothetical protein